MYREEKVQGAVDANIGYFEIFGIGKSQVGSGRGGGRRGRNRELKQTSESRQDWNLVASRKI